MRVRRVLLYALLAAAFFLASCASNPPAGEKAAAPARQGAKEQPDRKLYEGNGQDASMLKAMNMAKMDAVRQAVIEMIGAAAEKANRDKLEKILYNTDNPNAYIFNDAVETLRKDKLGDAFVFGLKVPVNLKAVESALRANGLLGGEVVSAETKTAQAAAAEQEVTPEEAKIIARYVDKMTYMVYFNESSGADPFYMKAAVGIANEFLASNSMEAIDLQQVEALKKDRQKAYEEETGKSITMIQWLAQKLNADVYIEIDGVTSGESAGGKHYGQANITLKGFEASTGRLLGSQPWNSPKTFSTASQQAARINALQTSVYKAMPIVIGQAKAYMAKALKAGIKYEVIIHSTPDAKVMSAFRRRLVAKVKDVQTVSQTAEETRYFVFMIGSVEELVDTIFETADKVDGLQGLQQVLLRGKSVTFNSGM